MMAKHGAKVLAVASVFLIAASSNGLNARFIKWQEKAQVVHIFGFTDDGRVGQPAAQADEGQPILFGFEWRGVDLNVEELQDALTNNPDHDLAVSVDGGASTSIKGSYQDAFFAETNSGPKWSWDHDADGPGDGDGDGVDDWNGPIIFVRYQHPGLGAGTHTFVFTLTDPGDPIIDGATDTITVQVGP